MPRRSAGLLLFRSVEAGIEVLLVHPGGPFWARKDEGAWSVPKGEHAGDEDPIAAARREFEEETGARAPDGHPFDLGEIVQSGRKIVTAFALRGDFDPATLRSNTVTLQWPPRSGQVRDYPEVDRAAWFTPDLARAKIVPAQAPFIDRLLSAVGQGRAG